MWSGLSAGNDGFRAGVFLKAVLGASGRRWAARLSSDLAAANQPARNATIKIPISHRVRTGRQGRVERRPPKFELTQNDRLARSSKL
jgi:hypothetical protein